MNERRLPSPVWVLGVLAVLTGCATRPMLPDVDTSALLAVPRIALEPAIVTLPQDAALRAPATPSGAPAPAAVPAPCVVPPGDAIYASAIRAPVRSRRADDVRALFGGRPAYASDDAASCPGGT